MSNKKALIILICTLFLFQPVFSEIVITQPSSPGEPSQADVSFYSQIIQQNATILQQLGQTATKADLNKSVTLAVWSSQEQNLEIIIILFILFEILHWVIFFQYIGQGKIPVLRTKAEAPKKTIDVAEKTTPIKEGAK